MEGALKIVVIKMKNWIPIFPLFSSFYYASIIDFYINQFEWMYQISKNNVKGVNITLTAMRHEYS